MFRIFLFSLFMISSLVAAAQTKLLVTDLTCEYQNNPLGLDVSTPRFSWKLASTLRDVLQASYELKVATDAQAQKAIWQSSKTASERSILVPYGGIALKPKTRYYWQVRVTDNKGNVSPWSDIKFFETGMLQPSDWTAQWIEPEIAGDAVGKPSPMLRKNFTLKKIVKSARLYITAHGLYEAHINGQRVGNQYLTPGWTSYNKRLQYQVYDVTALVRNGTNATGVLLGDGWYRGHLAWNDNKNIYGKSLGLLYQLEVTYGDGSKETISSDAQWKSSTGPITRSGIYYGEAYDARLEKTGWTQPEYKDTDWGTVKVVEGGKDNLVATYGPPVLKHETFKPVKIFKTPKGETVVDFGQNLVGWVTLKVKGKAGDKVTIRHAEVLDKAKNFYLDNLRAAQAELVYTLKGTAEETYEPRFTFYGFRYIRIEGYPGTLTPESLKATAVYSDMKPTGAFTSSNSLVNQLQHNIQWGQKGNFVDVPTDCPQRDERLGWTGDAQVFSRTAAYNMSVASFFTKWMKDVAADQREDGAVPFVVPNVLNKNDVASAGWADAAVIIPWNIYMAYGDKKILENQYQSMAAWIGYMEHDSKGDDLWNSGFHFGDWLFYRPFDDNDGRSAVTDKYLIAQCFWANSTQIMINTANALGKTEDAQRYTQLLQRIKDAFLKEYVTPSGRLVSGTQTAYVLALNFDMLPESLRAQAAERLAHNVKDYGNHLTTGFLGTPYLCEVLTRFGYTHVAYDLLMQESYPSWLYPVKMGATTIWERWDGMKPDSTFQTPGMNSFNHYAYGAIGDWMYRTVAGIREASPGYQKISLAPEPGGNLTQATAELQTPYGLVQSSWKIENGTLSYDISVPANATAEVILPKAAAAPVTEQKTALAKTRLTSEKSGDNLKIKVGSGSYHFEYPWK